MRTRKGQLGLGMGHFLLPWGMDGSKQHNKKWAGRDRGTKKGPWKGAGDNHRFLMDWVRFPETKLAFPIGSSSRHMTGLHSWLERGQEERPSHLPIIMFYAGWREITIYPNLFTKQFWNTFLNKDWAKEDWILTIIAENINEGCITKNPHPLRIWCFM